MEGWKTLIQAFDKLEEETRAPMVQIFAECLKNNFEMNKEELFKALDLGNTETLVALKILEMTGNVPCFKKLIEMSRVVENPVEVFEVALKYYKDLFFQEVLGLLNEFPLKSQEGVLETIKKIERPGQGDLESLVFSIERTKKVCDDNQDLLVTLHHRLAMNLLQKNMILKEWYFSIPYFNDESILSKELIHYIPVIPQGFFNETRLRTLEQDLINRDLNIRRNSMFLLKFKNSVEAKSPHWSIFWEIYESLENYNKAMISGPWKRVYSLLSWDSSKVALLFKRGQIHENLTVRRFIAKNYMKQSSLDATFTESIFIEFLSDPGLYSDSVELVGKSRFGETISKFLVKFIKTSKDPIRSLSTIIKNSFQIVQFQVAFKYFIEAFDQVFDQRVVDCEIIEKGLNVVQKQASQLTPFQRFKALRFLKRIVEGNDCRFLVEKVRLAVKLPFVCEICFEMEEALDIVQDGFEKVFRGESMSLSHSEFACIFAMSYSHNSMKMSSSLLTSLQSIYRNTYLKPDQIKTWVSCLFSLIKYLNKYKRESVSSYLNIVLDEIFSFAFSTPDKDLTIQIGKLIKQILKNGSTAFIPWSLSKLSLLKDSLILDTSKTLSILSLILPISKAIKSFNSPELSKIFSQISENLSNLDEKKIGNRENLHHLTELKWKVLAFLSDFSNSNIFDLASDQVDSSSPQMLESLFSILSSNLIEKLIFHKLKSLEILIEKCWNLVLETKNDAPLGIVVSFSRLAFNETTLFLPWTGEFLKKVLRKGEVRWGITRVVLFQLAPLWVKHEEAVVNYADSIFELTFYEEPRPEDTDFLVPCLFALVNEPKPHIKGDLHSLRSQYIRVFVLKLIQKVKNQKFLEKIFGKTVEELYQACQDRAEFPNSWVYKKKIRMAHLLCSLAPWCRELCRKDVLETNVKILIEIVKLTYVHSARQYIERFLIVILLKYPELTTHIQVDYDMRPQLAGSFILILGAVMVFSQNIQENSKIFSKVLPFMISNTAHIRRTCHFVIFKFLSLNPEFRSTSSIFEYLYTNKECQKMMKKLENSLISFESLKTCDLDFILSGHFSDFDEIIHNSLIAEIDEQCKHLLDLGYDVNYQEVWKNISQEIPQVLPGASNFQRKVEDTQALVELRTSRGVQQRHELVIVASLVDKLPNLAGLTRTSEVFNLQLITMAVKNVLNDSEFKSMAVTADKWLPIMEVGKSDLEKFLRLYRQKGYKIIGLEQTANSISMEKFKFISKSVLVLGHEKDGIPSDLLSLLDACLEIPQFGLIRSLNVHVSASICIWEYMKQLYLV